MRCQRTDPNVRTSAISGGFHLNATRSSFGVVRSDGPFNAARDCDGQKDQITNHLHRNVTFHFCCWCHGKWPWPETTRANTTPPKHASGRLEYLKQATNQGSTEVNQRGRPRAARNLALFQVELIPKRSEVSLPGDLQNEV